ncbi:uncharacterized protein VTP21DRAFT_2420 [Calcarisporiella thermophila]|uniref:uncharacterized protein n=1 Tax=Calcarisporiella thermophila TaxID=911321 RepID=UPI003741EEAE
MSSDATSRLTHLWDASHILLTKCPQLSAYYLSEFQRLANIREINLAATVRRGYCSHCGSLFVPGFNCRVRVEKEQPKNCDKKPGKKKRKRDVPIQRSRSNVVIQFAPDPPSQATATSLSAQEATDASDDPLRNHVSYYCNVCGRETRHSGTKTSTLQQLGALNLDSPLTSSPSTAPLPSSNTAAEKQKKSTVNSAPGQSKGELDTPANRKRKKKKMDLQALLAKDKQSKAQLQQQKSTGLSLDDFLSSL